MREVQQSFLSSSHRSSAGLLFRRKHVQQIYEGEIVEMVRVVGDDVVEYADEGVVAAGMEKDARYWEEGTTRCAGLKSTVGKDTNIAGSEREGQTAEDVDDQWDPSQAHSGPIEMR